MNNQTSALTPALKALNHYFGYDSFRPGQQVLINAILSGRDVLGIMPTGAGKSICYQIPAILMDGITLVISPLISLMKDQVTQLNQAGVRAAYINSTLTLSQTRKALYLASKGTYKIIYVAPERLSNEYFLSFVRSANISMIAVDEAHCVSQWGQNFRPTYLNIASFANSLPRRPVLAAFTATATGPVRADILHLLVLRNPQTLTTGYDRPNLYFAVRQVRSSQKDDALIDFLEKHPRQSGIIYCATRKETEKVAATLCEKGFPCAMYHAGLSDEVRSKSQDDFQFDRVPYIAATCAFGMGINKSNVRFVVHYSMPTSLENYYQEAGRAGRDGLSAECLLLYSPNDPMVCQSLLKLSYENENDENLQRDLARLRQMQRYATTQMCLRAFILQYFGESSEGKCSGCSNCDANWVEQNVSSEAEAVFRLLREMPRQYGMALVRDVLKGKKSSRIRDAHLDTLPHAGALSSKSVDTITALLEGLIMQGYLVRSSDQYQVLSITRKFAEHLQEKKPILIRSKSRLFERPSSHVLPTAHQAITSGKNVNEALFEKLRAKRLALSQAQSVPPYTIFSDATLQEMARTMPLTKEEMKAISGVGEIRLEKYGNIFLSLISDFISSPES